MSPCSKAGADPLPCLDDCFFGGKEGGFYVSYGSLSVSFRFLRFCVAYLPVE